MTHNPNRLLVVMRAETLVVEIHGYAKRHRHALGDLSPGLRNQLLRAAVSIALNLGEACGYHSSARVISLLEVSIGSCNEVERILALCSKLGLADSRSTHLLEEVAAVRAMTYGFRRHLRGTS